MDLRLILATGIRIFSIFMGLEAFKTLYSISAAQSFANTDSTGYIFSALYMAIAIVSWLFPITISAIIIPLTKESEKSTIKPIEFARVGTSLFALYLILSNAWALFPGYVLLNNQFDIDPTRLYSAIFMSAIGLMLLLSNKKLAVLMCK